ncbi:hypothetical protein D3C74_364400 [compost metagenome]
MRIDLCLQRLQLVGFIRQVQLVLIEDQIVDRPGHSRDLARQQAEFILPFHIHMRIQLSDLHLLGEGDQLLDRSGEANRDKHGGDSAHEQKQYTNTGIEAGDDPGISIQIFIGNQLNNAAFEQRVLNMPVHDNPLESVLFPGKMTAAAVPGKLAPARFDRPRDPVGIRSKQRLPLII